VIGRPRHALPCPRRAVLNARRHRDGDRIVNQDDALMTYECSTPGGIETVIGAGRISTRWPRSMCSTPGGIETVIGGGNLTRDRRLSIVLNARRHRDGDRRGSTSMGDIYAVRCSTPGGIETVIGRVGPPQGRAPSLVLNARRHRDGDRTRNSRSEPCPIAACSTPGGIETVIGCERRSGRLRLEVLNARRHRDGDRSDQRLGCRRGERCSTPGGIETVIGRASRAGAVPASCAQRPEASRR